MRDYPHIHESILFGFPGDINDDIVINCCILYVKHFIYREKLNIQNRLTIDFLSYLSHLKYILKIEKALRYQPHDSRQSRFITKFIISFLCTLSFYNLS